LVQSLFFSVHVCVSAWSYLTYTLGKSGERMCEAFGGNAKAKALEVAIAVACQGQSKDNANLRAALKLRHFRGAPVVMCCVIFFVFRLLRYFILLFRSTHTCTHAHTSPDESSVCFIQFFIPHKGKRIWGKGWLEQEIAWFMLPSMLAIIHWCHLACFNAYPSDPWAPSAN